VSLNGSLGLGFTLTAKDLASGVFRSAGNNLSRLQFSAQQSGNHMATAFVDANGRMHDSLGRFTKGAQGAQGALARMGSTGLSSFSGLGGLLAGASFVGLMGAAISKANEFTDALAQLRAVSGATAPQMEQLRRAALDAGIATQFNPAQAAGALTDLASAGYNAGDSMKLLIPTLDLAAASLGQLTPSDAAGLASSTLKAFSINVKDSGAVVDKLIQTMNLFAVQAKDLPLGIAGISRGATAMNQNLDESLIAFGLVRNIMPRVESASTAVSTAMERMVDPKVQGRLKGLGVSVTDTAGKFRPFLDVVGDLIPELAKMTDAKKAAFLQHTFGAEALGGFNAIMNQVTNGIQTSTGETVKGAAAIKYLRDQFRDSAGTAGKFRDELLKDLPGQLRMLKGSVDTLMTVVGEPLAEALKPGVKALIQGLNAAIKWFDGLSKNAKKHMAEIALGIGALGTAFAIAGGPVTLVLGAIAAAFYGVKYAYEHNLGGIGDRINEWVSKLRLAWNAVTQVFSDGGFSGAVRTELNKAENSGIKNFAISAYVWFQRIKHFFEGLVKGFDEGMTRARPAIDALGKAFERLGDVLGLTTKNDPSANKDKWQKWGEVGARVGNSFATAIEWVANAITAVVEVATGFIDKFDGLPGLWDDASASGDQLRTALNNLAEALGISDPDKSASGWTKFGRVLGMVASVLTEEIGTSLKLVSNVINSISDMVLGFSDIIVGVFEGDWGRVWKGMGEVAIGVAKLIISTMGAMVQQVAKAIDAMGAIAKIDVGAESKVKGVVEGINKSLDDMMESTNDRGGGITKSFAQKRKEEAALAAAAAPSPVPGAMGQAFTNLAAAQPGAMGGAFANLAANLKAGPPHVTTTVHATIVVDGQQLDSSIQKVRHETRVRSGDDVAAQTD
jgi:TP901 family phage tail tape measure protein